ncbi:hypothetical protein KQX54_014242 [Cotesia glomerata]|uniref:Uncharacterized protein n=1 Tax=Cotesia glomerata TaxID=32391 RepID=A0AAV7I647_COTGL|nr:hypothetical protein KQX54_014242 [Cotesia glomerata]
METDDTNPGPHERSPQLVAYPKATAPVISKPVVAKAAANESTMPLVVEPTKPIINEPDRPTIIRHGKKIGEATKPVTTPKMVQV